MPFLFEYLTYTQEKAYQIPKHRLNKILSLTFKDCPKRLLPIFIPTIIHQHDQEFKKRHYKRHKSYDVTLFLS